MWMLISILYQMIYVLQEYVRNKSKVSKCPWFHVFYCNFSILILADNITNETFNSDYKSQINIENDSLNICVYFKQISEIATI